MGKEIHDLHPSAREIFNKAEDLTGMPLKKLCFEGPMEDLTLTGNLQPAVTTLNLAVLACLEEKGVKPNWVAGHSLGEYSALYAAGVSAWKIPKAGQDPWGLDGSGGPEKPRVYGRDHGAGS